MFGLMLTSTHKAAMAKKDAEVSRLNGSLFDALTKSAEWEAKFKKAVADLEKADREKEVLEDLLAETQAAERLLNQKLDALTGQILALNGTIDELRPDAEQMRRKRAGDRNRVRKPRDKRAKNRGGK